MIRTETDIAAEQEILESIPIGTMFTASGEGRDGKPHVFRCMRENETTVFRYAPRSTKYGSRYTNATFCMFHRLRSAKDENEEWHKRLKRAIKCMSSSGMWPELKERYENLLTITLEEKKELYDATQTSYRLWLDNDMTGSDRVLRPYAEKYPFAVTVTVDGHYTVDHNYIYEVSDCRLKSMYFGKWVNSRIKEELKAAIESGAKYSISRTVSYDVTATYDPANCHGRYSEEYRGCGNGHYYLMLDHSTAVFYEDD